MKLQGQAGYAMAALLVSLSVMAVMLTVAMPVWKQITQREKEAELVFRGTQYARAISLFQRKHGPGTLPPNIDLLVEEHVLRRKFKDPITNDDFKVLLQGQGPLVGWPAGRGSSSSTQTGRSSQKPPSTFTPTQIGQRASGPSAGPAGVGGVIGVQSKSTDTSIRIYNGRTHYNEWAFIFQPPVQAPGTGARGSGLPGRQGGPGGPGQRGGTTLTPFGPGGRGRGAQPTAPPGSRGGFTIGPDGRIQNVNPNSPNNPPPGRRGSGQQPPPRRPGG